jgi:hypothetical protein
MILVVGLIILVAAVIAGVAGVLSNGGGDHALTHGFAVFGYHVTGSTGMLFLFGIVVGVIGLFGLMLLLGGARRTARRGRAGRRRLQQSRRETAVVSQERDDLIGQREAARADAASAQGNGSSPADTSPADTSPADTASAPRNGSPPADRHPGPDEGRRNWLQMFGRRPAPQQAPAPRQQAPAPRQPPATDQESLNGQPAPDVPAGASAPAK